MTKKYNSKSQRDYSHLILKHPGNQVFFIIDNQKWNGVASFGMDDSMIADAHKETMQRIDMLYQTFSTPVDNQRVAKSFTDQLHDMAGRYKNGNQSFTAMGLLAASVLILQGRTIQNGDAVYLRNSKSDIEIRHAPKDDVEMAKSAFLAAICHQDTSGWPLNH